jgi:hypothetical protein
MAILTPRDNILEWWCYRAALSPHLKFIRIIKDQDPLFARLAEVGPKTLLYLYQLHILEPHHLCNGHESLFNSLVTSARDLED